MEFPNKRILWADGNPNEYDTIYDLICDLVGKNHLKRVRIEPAALNALQTFRYDVFITECALPWDRKMIKENIIRLEAGTRLIEQLRGNTSWKTKSDCPVIVFSSHLGSRQRWDRIQELVGKNGILLQKPQRKEVVLEEIRKILTT